MESKETEMEKFMRIAMAILRKVYKNPRQRKAWAAKMYSRWKNL